ncbi:GNAT family N-acetyltransferase [Kitasatospora sp. MBT66]|uniref:GNAT family N-acetyltransferase n=1 Tax=Kitasatospora sp. MBT66 TaxID=1444769 RepID=UPI0005BB8D4C|nr:GNAT family N-acetyltransferase [Kitasatospora sp. MBT66]
MIRAFRPDTDYPALAELLSADGAGPPVTAAELRGRDAALPNLDRLATDRRGRLTGHGRVRLVQPGPTGDLLGYATAWRAPWTPPGDLASLVVSAPGRAPAWLLPLYDGLERWGREAGAGRLLGELPDGHDGSATAGRDPTADLTGLLLGRGYRVDAHVRSASAPLGPHLPAPQPPPGLYLDTLATTLAPEPEQQLHHLYRETLRDNPGFADALPEFDGWRAEVLAGPGGRPDWVFTAECTGRIVGATVVHGTDDPTACHVHYTAVLRAWRGRGLARALKLHAARHLLGHGVRTAHTEVEAGNVPMVAVNAALGYRWGAGHRRLVKEL